MAEYLPATMKDRLRELRDSKRMSQQDVADMLGIRRETYSKYENGETESIKSEHLITLAKYYDVTADFILGICDIADKTHFEIGELGLTEDAALRMYCRDVDMTVVSALIENDQFAKATMLSGIYIEGIMQEFDDAEKDINLFSKSIINELKCAGDLPKDDRLLNATDISLGLCNNSSTQTYLENIRKYFMAAIRDIRNARRDETEKERIEKRKLNNQMLGMIKAKNKRILHNRAMTMDKKRKFVKQTVYEEVMKTGKVVPEQRENLKKALGYGLAVFVNNNAFIED